MKWNDWCSLSAGDMVDALQMWEDGEDEGNLKDLFISFLDDFLLRFKPSSSAETWSDMVLATLGGAAFDQVKPRFLALLGAGLHTKPLEKLIVT